VTANSMHALDFVILVVYLAALAGVGIYFSRRQTSLDDYFLARQSMSWLPVGLSLMAALDSAIDYLMQPSATIRYGLVLLTGTTSWLFLYPWVAHVTLPFYRRLNYFTAYEYLEARFDVRVRSLAAGIFIAWRLGDLRAMPRNRGRHLRPPAGNDDGRGARRGRHGVHRARRREGGDLERRHAVLRPLRRPGGGRHDCDPVGARRRF
jgi:Sodium:solute symporter family